MQSRAEECTSCFYYERTVYTKRYEAVLHPRKFISLFSFVRTKWIILFPDGITVLERASVYRGSSNKYFTLLLPPMLSFSRYKISRTRDTHAYVSNQGAFRLIFPALQPRPIRIVCKPIPRSSNARRNNRHSTHTYTWPIIFADLHGIHGGCMTFYYQFASPGNCAPVSTSCNRARSPVTRSVPCVL